jgi:multiple sugar transport system substrate-binding protein
MMLLSLLAAACSVAKIGEASVHILTRHTWRDDAMRTVADEYHSESGSSTVNVTGSKDFVDEMVADLSSGTTLYDVYFTRMSSLGSAGDKLYDFGPLLSQDGSLEWTDVSRFYRTSGSVLDARVVNLPLQAELLYFSYRKDILDQHGLEAPKTVEEMVDLAVRFNGVDLNGDKEPDFGFCQFMGKKKPLEAEGKLLFSLLAPFLQSQGTASGAMFDPDTFEPLIGNAGAREAFDLPEEPLNEARVLKA